MDQREMCNLMQNAELAVTSSNANVIFTCLRKMLFLSFIFFARYPKKAEVSCHIWFSCCKRGWVDIGCWCWNMGESLFVFKISMCNHTDIYDHSQQNRLRGWHRAKTCQIFNSLLNFSIKANYENWLTLLSGLDKTHLLTFVLKYSNTVWSLMHEAQSSILG